MRSLLRTAASLCVLACALAQTGPRLAGAHPIPTSPRPAARETEVARVRHQLVRHVAKIALTGDKAQDHPALELLLRHQAANAPQSGPVPLLLLTNGLLSHVPGLPALGFEPLLLAPSGELRQLHMSGVLAPPSTRSRLLLGIETDAKLVQHLNDRLLKTLGLPGDPTRIEDLALAIDTLDRASLARPIPRASSPSGPRWEQDVETIFPHAQILFSVLAPARLAPGKLAMELAKRRLPDGSVERLFLQRHETTRRLEAFRTTTQAASSGQRIAIDRTGMAAFGLGSPEALRALLEAKMVNLAPEDYE